jgi:dihydroxy-acid dehydratase
MVELDVPARTLNMLVSEEELAVRRAAWKPAPVSYQRGYTKLYQQHVSQANKGCDFDFLEGNAETLEPPIF